MDIRKYLEDNKGDFLSEESQMTGAEIAKELKITRQAVSQALKRALVKVFNETKKLDKTWNAFEVAVTMSQIFGVDQDSPEELVKFFRLFPPDLKKKIEEDAEKWKNQR